MRPVLAGFVHNARGVPGSTQGIGALVSHQLIILAKEVLKEGIGPVMIPFRWSALLRSPLECSS